MKRKITYSVFSILGILLIIGAGFSVREYKDLSKPGIIVLLYHRIIDKNDIGSKYVLSLSRFEQQLDLLTAEGYTTVLPKEIIDGQGADRVLKKIILSFDDGTSDHYSLVYPMLKRKRMSGIFFIVTKCIGKSDAMTEDQILELAQNGMEIGSHSRTHQLLDQMDERAIYYELSESKKILESIIGNRVISFAPPDGWFDDRTVLISNKMGYKAFFGCEIGTNDLAKQPYVLKRIEVLGNMTLEEFKDLLNPPKILPYKITQSLKFFAHGLLGSKNYERFSSSFGTSE